ncbi:hypothetical protein EYF80_008742 [Liparis tanakae]|uniref:Uncharacterized protein n=1 Tax=Liparis tanakae TaxID=230148 RepID=A0A4Z2ITA9_9TELE|nr:hypothetical protein EYF80_008742 [Liparis tanakae]
MRKQKELDSPSPFPSISTVRSSGFGHLLRIRRTEVVISWTVDSFSQRQSLRVFSHPPITRSCEGLLLGSTSAVTQQESVTTATVFSSRSSVLISTQTFWFSLTKQALAYACIYRQAGYSAGRSSSKYTWLRRPCIAFWESNTDMNSTKIYGVNKMTITLNILKLRHPTQDDDRIKDSRSYLASPRHLQAVHRSRYLDALDLAVLAALVLDILYNLLIFFVIQQLFWCHHVHQTQHLSGQATHLMSKPVGDGQEQVILLQGLHPVKCLLIQGRVAAPGIVQQLLLGWVKLAHLGHFLRGN